jgi:hypothetical protein
MAEQVQTPTDEELRVWQPSLAPEHRLGGAGESRTIIAEQAEPHGVFGVILAFLKRPFVQLILGLGLFILGAIVYDNTVNYGSWTERAAKPKATKHKGIEAIPQTPE